MSQLGPFSVVGPLGTVVSFLAANGHDDDAADDRQPGDQRQDGETGGVGNGHSSAYRNRRKTLISTTSPISMVKA